MRQFPKRPDPIPMTSEGLSIARAKCERLLAKREVVLVELQRAREMGDLSENGAYKAARFELSDVDRELRRLNHVLKYAVAAEKISTSVIGMGNTVTLLCGNKKIEAVIVSTYESDPDNHKLSVDSPIGKAILGKKEGETIEVETPDGKVVWEILSVA